MKGALVDPGGDVEKLYKAVTEQQVTIEKVILTHGHLDHVGGTTAVATHYNVPIIGPHIGDKFWLDALMQQSQMFGFPEAEIFTPDRWLEDDQTVTVGNQTLQVLHCPGHTPGHVVFYHPETELALVGDVLFNGSIGRTDFPQGNHEQLISSIRDKLFPLGDNVTFIPGHGPISTFGHERQTNPFVSDHRG